MNSIYFFTIATNTYKEYLNKFVKSLDNCFPDNDKKLIVISDKDYINNINNIYTYNYHICDTNYALCALQKYTYIYDSIQYIQLKLKKNDLIFFCDVDSYFIEKSKSYWNKIYNSIIKYDICISIFPWNYNDTNKYRVMKKYKNIPSIAQINKFRYNLLCASFLIAKPFWFNKIYKLVDLLTAYDMANLQNGCRIIPELPEQEYLNKIIQENIINTNNIWVDYFQIISNDIFLQEKHKTLNDFLENNEYIFSIKDYDPTIKLKNVKRNLSKSNIMQFIKNESNNNSNDNT